MIITNKKYIAFAKNLLSATILSAITYLIQFVATIKYDSREFSLFQLGNSFSRIIQSFNFGLSDFVVAEIPLLRDKVNLKSFYLHLLFLLFCFLTIGLFIATIILQRYLNGFDVIVYSNVLSGFLFAMLSLNLFFLFASGNYKFYRLSIFVTGIFGLLFLLIFFRSKEYIYILPVVPAFGVIYSSIILMPSCFTLRLRMFPYILKKVFIYGLIGVVLIIQSQIDKILMYSVVEPTEYALYTKLFVYFFPLTFLYSQIDKNIYVDVLSTNRNSIENNPFWITYTRLTFTLSSILIFLSFLAISFFSQFDFLSSYHEQLIYGVLLLNVLGYMISPLANFLWAAKKVIYQLGITLFFLILTVPIYLLIGEIMPNIYSFLIANSILQLMTLSIYFKIFLKFSGIKPSNYIRESVLIFFSIFLFILSLYKIELLYMILIAIVMLSLSTINLINILRFPKTNLNK